MNMHEQLRAAMAAAQAAHDSSTVAVFPGKDSDDENAPQPVNELPDTFVSVADAARPVIEEAKRNIVKLKGLDEKAVLVQVKRRMYSPYKLDEAESRAYGAGNVNKHLFQGRDNRVKQAIAAYTAVYTFVKDNTVPWSTGIDMLNIDHYMEFTSGLRKLIDSANDAVADLVDNWDYEVNADYSRLLPTGHANYDDYPTAEEVQARFGIEVRYMPVPTTGDFRVAISEEDRASLQKQLDDAEANASKHVLTQMIEPMTAAVKKLTVKIGDEGSIFRDSLIDNMVDVANRMAKVNISDDPAIRERIKDLQALVGAYANNKDVLRNSQSVREKAATQIDNLMSQMVGLV